MAMPEDNADLLPPLPMAQSIGLDAAVDAPADARAPPGRQPGLLLVDDDPFMLGVQSRMLRDMGYSKIRTAASAEAALMLLGPGQASVDVVICDLNMPNVDGLEFLRRLGNSDFRGNVILLSGEGPRIIHAVRKLLARHPLHILGSLGKPACRASLRTLLDRWQPMVPPQAAAPSPAYTAADLQAAQQAEQWVLHYQPKIDLRTGELTGTEALVRWNHPAHGLV